MSSPTKRIWSRHPKHGAGTHSLTCMQVCNLSPRYMRVWLARLPAPSSVSASSRGAHALQQLSVAHTRAVQEVVAPGGSTVMLWACLHAAAAGAQQPAAGAAGAHSSGSATECSMLLGGGGGGGGAGDSLHAVGSEPDRYAAAEALCGTWVVCYHVISGEDQHDGVAAHAPPHGIVRLSAVDAARVRGGGGDYHTTWNWM